MSAPQVVGSIKCSLKGVCRASTLPTSRASSHPANFINTIHLSVILFDPPPPHQVMGHFQPIWAQLPSRLRFHFLTVTLTPNIDPRGKIINIILTRLIHKMLWCLYVCMYVFVMQTCKNYCTVGHEFSIWTVQTMCYKHGHGPVYLPPHP